MIPRRRLLIASGLLTLGAALNGYAQERRVRRIGFFFLTSVQSSIIQLAAFRQGLSELHWVEGRDYIVESRIADGKAEDAPRLADELIASRPDLILTGFDEAVRMLAQRTNVIPIVFAASQDPMGSGRVASLQHPGGNVTGLTTLVSELGPKRLQLLKEAFPRIAHVGLLFEPANVSGASQAKVIEDAAGRLGIRVTPLALTKDTDIAPAFQQGAKMGVQAYIGTSTPLIVSRNQRRAIGAHLLRSRLPSIFAGFEGVDAGGLMSYSTSVTGNFRRAATYVDKILKGIKPGDLPVEQPTRFELAVNLKAARTMGLNIPKAFLARADRVIE